MVSKVVVTGLVVLCSGLLAGCITEEGAVGPPASDEGLGFEWSPSGDVDRFAVLLEVNAGPDPDAVCRGSGGSRGHMGHESGMGHFSASWVNGTFHGSGGSGRWELDTVQAGPVNTARIIGPAWATDTTTWRTSWEFDITHGTEYRRALFGFGAYPDRTFARVECDSTDATIRFSKADAVVPIRSETATGVFGFDVGLGVAGMDRVAMNHGSKYTMETESEFVVFHVSSSNGSSEEGELEMITPGGSETVPMEDGFWDVGRLWNDSGTYEINFDRVAVNKRGLVGILAGFVLEEEVGGSNEG